MHSSKHACNEAINSIALMNKRDKCGDFALVVCRTPEMREYKLLEGIDLVLKLHKIRDRLVSRGELSDMCLCIGMIVGKLYPSFGSFIVLKLMYSSYSKVPDREGP